MKCIALILASAFCLGCSSLRMRPGDWLAAYAGVDKERLPQIPLSCGFADFDSVDRRCDSGIFVQEAPTKDKSSLELRLLNLRIGPPPHLPMLVLFPDRPPGYFQRLPIGVRVIAQPPGSSGQENEINLLPDSPPSLEELLSHPPASIEHQAEPDSPRS